MRFHYPLQKIVDLKTTQKTQAEWILSHAVGILRDEESNLDQLYEQKSQLQYELQDKTTQSTTISSMMVTQTYINHLSNRIHEKNKQVEMAQTEVEQKKTILQSKMQDEKIWNITRDKAQMVFQTQVLKKEQDELDEIATVRFVNTAP
ncbi:hypothetical protein SY83_16035 [Paenibacillus swuensis]|uniref:Flagellar FliJ protein n=1 Tax=Paenibacillus swuensis TaxID=1178515 RepID=A0A172TKI7_9BACL|nr:flagellar export protein FliJ [Paenibacillus swuensis]ANE47540.1 hypothetical protein SY83_16035 [Paenibacillus swuensis]